MKQAGFMDSRFTWVRSFRTLMILGAIACLLFSVTGCQSLFRGSEESRESKYSLKKRKSYISYLPEYGGSAVICHLPLKVPEQSIDQLFSSIDGSIGTAYRPGGSTPDGFDCSGFVSYLYKKNFRMLLPRSAGEQALLGRLVQINELRPGDLVFFSISGSRIDHVGIFVGKNSFAHAASSGVMVNRLAENYYSHRYACAARLIKAD
jgi:murein DD-endopeptidase / murein LD-carboxypeptidase